VKDVDEKEAILKSLKDIAVNTKEQCIRTLKFYDKYKNIMLFAIE
jgi:hypothetical protein